MCLESTRNVENKCFIKYWYYPSYDGYKLYVSSKNN